MLSGLIQLFLDPNVPTFNPLPTYGRKNPFLLRDDLGKLFLYNWGRFLSAPQILDVQRHPDLGIILFVSISERLSTSVLVMGNTGHGPRCSQVLWEAVEVRAQHKTCSSVNVLSVTIKFCYFRSNTGKNVRAHT